MRRQPGASAENLSCAIRRASGEEVTREIVEYIVYARDKGCSMQGMEDPKVERLQVLKGDK